MEIILASKSPRRKELLDMMNLKYTAIVSDVDETFEEGLSIEEQSKRLGYIKAKKVFDETKGDRIVIGSDTMVLKENEILGKPRDEQDAFEMLKKLQNGKHRVITSLAILIQDKDKYKEYIDYDVSAVYIQEMSDEEIWSWVNSGQAMDKAGAYAVQSEFGKFITRLEGDYLSIMGLPINKLYNYIKSYTTSNKK